MATRKTLARQLLSWELPASQSSNRQSRTATVSQNVKHLSSTTHRLMEETANRNKPRYRNRKQHIAAAAAAPAASTAGAAGAVYDEAGSRRGAGPVQYAGRGDGWPDKPQE